MNGAIPDIPATDLDMGLDGVLAWMTPYDPSHPDYPNAPSDWDGGPYLCRDGGLYHMRGYGWEHGLGCWNPTADWDRVAYTPKAPSRA